ncbi:MAG: sigma-54-dependent Fis family transcriptional regulator [Owenweeksia sp.]|nr:sigma-54-dependent Fis family transcriptional regulator [Owenweeksia sp.]MBF98837.1 sigma-54-dependent Fis family transcriptional regulator [Owenweeksia sp.]HBF18969.1 sigma-54-dependent Fis family transcriptional regulator [Cryomorphaceae bacterium]
MKAGRILIVDDNKSALSALNLLLQYEFGEVVCLSNPNLIKGELEKQDFDVALLDMNFSAGLNTGNEGLYWLGEMKKVSPEVEVVMITAYGDVELAVKALKLGAVDFVLKPWDNEKLVATLKSALKLRQSHQKVAQLKNRESFLKGELNKGRQLIAGSAVMRKVMRMVEKVATTDANVLISGENGTGKEVIAQQIHSLSKRKNELLMNVDMGAIPESLFESELFGYHKGAFTDAKEDKVGKFQLADKGTLFLDEIGNVPMHLQSKLLVALESRTVFPLGSHKAVPVDIRLVAATNADLEKMVQEGSFRQDLLYRINTIKIELPPLRERGEDIELLAGHFLRVYQEKYHKPGLRLGSQAIRKLGNYHWPGNVRELQHTLEKAVILAEGQVLMPADFDLQAVNHHPGRELPSLSEMEKDLIINAMDRYEGNLSLIAEKLGITRQTLYNKIKRYEL